MRKYLVWLLVLGVWPMLLTGCKLLGSKEATPKETPLEIPAEVLEPAFESAEYGFRVKGPDGWVKKAGNLGMLVTYLKPGDPKSFQENISVAREMKEDLTLSDYLTATVAQVGEFFPDYELLEQKSVIIKGSKAEEVKYKIKTKGLDLTAEQIMIERPNAYLVITYMASSAVFEASHGSLERVLGSLIFVGPEAVE